MGVIIAAQLVASLKQPLHFAAARSAVCDFAFLPSMWWDWGHCSNHRAVLINESQAGLARLFH